MALDWTYGKRSNEACFIRTKSLTTGSGCRLAIGIDLVSLPRSTSAPKSNDGSSREDVLELVSFPTAFTTSFIHVFICFCII